MRPPPRAPQIDGPCITWVQNGARFRFAAYPLGNEFISNALALLSGKLIDGTAISGEIAVVSQVQLAAHVEPNRPQPNNAQTRVVRGSWES